MRDIVYGTAMLSCVAAAYVCLSFGCDRGVDFFYGTCVALDARARKNPRA